MLWTGAAQNYARCMMENVYSEFSAVLSLDAQGKLLGICQFDTAFGCSHMEVAEGAAEVWLVSNHPDGNGTLTREDERCLRMLSRRVEGAALRVFVAGEDIGLIELEADDGAFPYDDRET